MSDTEFPVLHLVRPMWGLESVRGLVVQPFGDPDSPFLVLTSVDDPDVELVVVNPECVHPGYTVEISDEDAEALGAEQAEDLLLFAVCNLSQRDEPTVNLLAPIVANWRNLAAAQVVLHGTTYPLRAPLFPATVHP